MPDAAAAGLAGRAASPRRVAIVGAGIAGLTLAWVLARRGHRVALYDAAEIPNPHNASWDDGRIIRHAYGLMRGYARQMPMAFAAWRALFADIGVDGLVPTRAVYPLRADGPWQHAVTEDLARVGFAAPELDEMQLAALPMLARQGVLRFIEVEGSGILRASAIVAGLVRWLAAAPGVTLHPHTRVASLDGVAAGSDAMVVAAGAGTPQLLADAARAAGLSVGLHSVAYLMPPEALAETLAGAPILSCRLPDHATGGIYVLPPRAGAALKIGAYAVTPDPDDFRTDGAPPRLHQALIDSLLEAAGIALENFDAYQVLRARHCRVVMAPEDRFVLRSLGQDRLMLSACSTHGFKLAPANALAIAAMLEARASETEVRSFIAGEAFS